jgi:hypothetical protein
MEQRSKPNQLLHKKALDKAIMAENSHVEVIIRGLNPHKLSPADISLLESYLESRDA